MDDGPLIDRLLAGDDQAALSLVRRHQIRTAPDAVDRLVPEGLLNPLAWEALCRATDAHRLDQAVAGLDHNRKQP